MAPCGRPPRYHNPFNAVFPMLMHYLLFHSFTIAIIPVSRQRSQSSCYKTAIRTPHKHDHIFYRYPYAGKLVNCQQQFAKLHHVVLKKGRNQRFISGGGAIFTKFHSMTSSCLFNRGTTFCKRSHIIIMCFFPQTRSPQYKHTFCTILVDKNRQNRTFYNSVGG